jgi:DNA-binding transcriptional LysR family regulator
MSSFISERQGSLRLGASTTISQYIISPVLARFHQKQKDIKVNLLNGNTEQIETALINKEIEIGIVEGQSKNQSIKYTQFLKDELVLVCSSKNPIGKQNEISVNDLKSMKFITRERGSGTLEVIEYALKNINLNLTDLQIEMQLGSTESIKSYLLNSDCFAFMSIHAVSKELKNNELMVLDIANLSIERYFYVITLMGKSDALSEMFMQNMSSYYNMKL